MATLQVSTQTQLDTALRSVAGGDTILLSAGTYSDLTLNKQFSQKVTIASAAGDSAVITKLLLRGASNVELKGMKLDYVPGKSGDSPFWIEGGRGITLTDVNIEGPSGGYAGGTGLRIKNSQDVSVLNSEIANFRNGLSATNSGNVKVLNNDFQGMSNDAMLLGGMTGMLIQGNDFRNMRSNPATAHKDMIQFFTGSGSPVSRDIVIRDNNIDNPERSHAIFFTNPAADGNRGSYFTDILIEGNYVRSGHTHGISMNHGDSVAIRNNTLVEHPASGDGAISVPLINVSTLSKDVVIQGNQVASVPVAQNGSWAVSGNDVGPKKYLHWYGNYGPVRSTSAAQNRDGDGYSPPASAPGAPGDGGTVSGGDGGQDLFRIYGGQLDDSGRRTIDSLDFADGDVIVFGNFDSGVFRTKSGGNPIDVWESGRSAKVDSARDLAELAALSPDISASTQGSDLVLRIDESEIVLDNLAAAFRAADQPDLF